MDYQECLGAVRRRFWLVLAAVAFSLLAAWAASRFLMKDVYESNATVMLSKPGAAAAGGGHAQQDILLDSNTIRVYYNLAESDSVAGGVIRRLQLGSTEEKLREQIGVTVDYNTGIMKISSRAGGASLAREITEAFLQSLEEEAGKLSLTADIRTIDAPKAPAKPVSPNLALNALLAGVGGMLAGVLLALLFGAGDQSAGRMPALPAGVSGASLLGALPKIRGFSARKAPVPIFPEGGMPGEAVKVLRANLLYCAERSGIKTIIVTSPGIGEGKTTFAVNIAASLAQMHKRVLLAECNFRNPTLLKLYQTGKCTRTVYPINGSPGGNMLVYTFPALGFDIVLDLVSQGERTEDVCSPAITGFLDEMALKYDFILLDCPPALPYADTLTISRLAQGAVVVADYGRLACAGLEQCVARLGRIEASILGIVLNNMPPAKAFF